MPEDHFSNSPNLTQGYQPPQSVAVLLERYAAGERYFPEADIPEGSSLNGANLEGAIFSNAWLSCVDFQYANLKGVQFNSCNIKCSDFRNADLRFASFQGTHVEATDFQGANLEGASFAGALLWCAKNTDSACSPRETLLACDAAPSAVENMPARILSAVFCWILDSGKDWSMPCMNGGY